MDRGAPQPITLSRWLHRVNRYPRLIVAIYLVAGTLLLAEMLGVDLWHWRPGSLSVAVSLVMVTLASALPRLPLGLFSATLASGLVGCLEYIPWLANATSSKDLWRNDNFTIMAGTWAMAVALVLALPLRWLRALEDQPCSKNGCWLWERCGLWLASLVSLYAVHPWATSKALGLWVGLALLGVVAAAISTLASALPHLVRRLEITRCLGGAMLLLGFGVAPRLGFLRDRDGFGAIDSRAWWWFASILLGLYLALVPGLFATRCRYRTRSGEKLAGGWVVTVAFGLMLVWVGTIFFQGRCLDGLSTLSALFIVVWCSAPKASCSRVPRIVPRVPLWILALPVASVVMGSGTYWLLIHPSLIYNRITWLACTAALLTWTLPLAPHRDEVAAPASPTPCWLFSLRGAALLSTLLTLWHLGWASPLARVAAEWRSLAVMAEVRQGAPCPAGIYTRSGGLGLGVLYLAPKVGYVDVFCSYHAGCLASFGKADWSRQSIRFANKPLVGSAELVSLFWRRSSLLIEAENVPYLCGEFASKEWLERAYDPLGAWSMFPVTEQCQDSTHFELRPTLQSRSASCILPEPLEARPLRVWTDPQGGTWATWPKGARNGVFPKMPLACCKTGALWVVDSVKDTESVIRPNWPKGTTDSDTFFGAYFPCYHQAPTTE